jgi:hypothetical protein
MKVMIERMITVTQKIDTALVMKFLVTIIRIRKAKMMEATIPWKAPVTNASSWGIPDQAELVWIKLFISYGAFSL